MIEYSKPTIICLTPVRNNANFLDRFLLSASLWADYIIICDQMSTDGSREIAKKYQKVILIDNPSEEYNERERVKLLITEARKIKGHRLLITLDADEMLTPNMLKSTEWQIMLHAKLGSIFKFQWANFQPDLKTMWLGYHFAWGYMDDEFEHESDNIIHVSRIPLPPYGNVFELNEIKVIHFQYTDWANMQSKHRWYQCLERIKYPTKNAIDIFRQYHHMYAVPKDLIVPIPNDWILDYKQYDIDIVAFLPDTYNWFEKQTLNLIEFYGSNIFRKLNIWDVDWVSCAMKCGKEKLSSFYDPRNIIDKSIQFWLIKTQAISDKRMIRRMERVIKFIFKY